MPDTSINTAFLQFFFPPTKYEHNPLHRSSLLMYFFSSGVLFYSLQTQRRVLLCQAWQQGEVASACPRRWPDKTLGQAGRSGSWSWGSPHSMQWLPMGKAVGQQHCPVHLTSPPPTHATALPKTPQCIYFKLGIFHI